MSIANRAAAINELVAMLAVYSDSPFAVETRRRQNNFVYFSRGLHFQGGLLIATKERHGDRNDSGDTAISPQTSLIVGVKTEDEEGRLLRLILSPLKRAFGVRAAAESVE